jgi:hypothetical protein
MIRRMAAISTAMPRLVPRKGKRCVSFDCQLAGLSGGAGSAVWVFGLVGFVLMVLVLVMVGSPPSMRGFEAGLVDIVREGGLWVDETLEWIES